MWDAFGRDGANVCPVPCNMPSKICRISNFIENSLGEFSQTYFTYKYLPCNKGILGSEVCRFCWVKGQPIKRSGQEREKTCVTTTPTKRKGGIKNYMRHISYRQIDMIISRIKASRLCDVEPTDPCYHLGPVMINYELLPSKVSSC